MKKHAVWLKWNNVSDTPTKYLRVLVKPGITFWLRKLEQGVIIPEVCVFNCNHSALMHKYLQPVKLVLDKSSCSDPTASSSLTAPTHAPCPQLHAAAMQCWQLLVLCGLCGRKQRQPESSQITAINPWTGTENLYLKALSFSYFLKGC